MYFRGVHLRYSTTNSGMVGKLLLLLLLARSYRAYMKKENITWLASKRKMVFAKTKFRPGTLTAGIITPKQKASQVSSI